VRPKSTLIFQNSQACGRKRGLAKKNLNATVPSHSSSRKHGEKDEARAFRRAGCVKIAGRAESWKHRFLTFPRTRIAAIAGTQCQRQQERRSKSQHQRDDNWRETFFLHPLNVRQVRTQGKGRSARTHVGRTFLGRLPAIGKAAHRDDRSSLRLPFGDTSECVFHDDKAAIDNEAKIESPRSSDSPEPLSH